MRQGDINASVATLAAVDGRADAARVLAIQAGAESLLLLVRNTRVDLMLPAPGMPKTLPGGPAWKSFVRKCLAPGAHRDALPVPDGTGEADVAACSSGEVALLFVGGAVADATLEGFRPTLPLLAELLRAQMAHDICQGELSAAQFEMRQYASLARSLDETRAQLDATVHELGIQAARLREQHARAEQATRAKDEFLAMLGHELRNPLAPIVTVLEVLRMRGQWTPEHAIMRRQVKHLQRLVDDLLDVSRIARGKLTLERRVVELSGLIAAASETVHPLFAQKEQELTVEVADEGLPLLADPARMTQVFANLLTNASKYSEPGTVVRVRAKHQGDQVIVEVEDEGIGISPEMLPRVFDLFEQETSSQDRSPGGLGLGLSIVHNLVAQHGGQVRAHSAGPGHGSRFEVCLPLARGPVTSDDSGRAGMPAGERGQTRILLVDDNADAVTTLADALRIAGFVVEVAHDGPGALDVAGRFRPDLAVLDIGLPGMDGYALAEALHRLLEDRPPRLVALTGYGQAGAKRRAMKRGFDVHMVKPVDLGELHRVIGELLPGA